MCSIFASKDFNEFKKLSDLNSYRGCHSFSIAGIKDNKLKIFKQNLGKIDFSDIPQDQDYYIGHQQAPTNSEVSNDTIHPSILDFEYMDEKNKSYLYHNGIIKSAQCKQWSDFLLRKSETLNWDTHLLHLHLIRSGNLNNIDGSFACIQLIETLDSVYMYLWRNELSPLFVDGNINISSTKFEGSYAVTPDKLYQVDLKSNSLNAKYKFKTINNPYYFEKNNNIILVD